MMSPKEVVTAYFRAVSERRFADAGRFFSPDSTLWIVGEGRWSLGGLHDRAGVGAIHELAQARFPEGLKIVAHGMIAEDDRVAVEAESYGVRSDGRVYNNRYHYVFVVRDEKIVERREYLDTLHAADVLVGPLDSGSGT